MIYTVQEKVETVSWSTAISTAPAEMVRAATEMAAKGEIAQFAKSAHSQTGYHCWVLLTVNDHNLLVVAKRDNTPVPD